MKRFLYSAGFIAVLAGAGAIFLLTWDIPAPSERVETVIDDDRFPK